ncbi:hypothetical protein H5410_024386 [Solanum commersonii]|uniref:Uncharacterized protein n=1 Tax=Solanum commersonii TaxID=4109 RepID=A0A9J5ZLT1_SOLCO|nr:hypothetical protein H5410_024386 [Solanum commersonii]
MRKKTTFFRTAKQGRDEQGSNDSSPNTSISLFPIFFLIENKKRVFIEREFGFEIGGKGRIGIRKSIPQIQIFKGQGVARCTRFRPNPTKSGQKDQCGRLRSNPPLFRSTWRHLVATRSTGRGSGGAVR